SELFGYEGGAFTGAKKGGHPGKFELAEGGTILLDEIGDMPIEMQAKLLRVLQEKRVHRIGGTREVELNARVIATTNRDLDEESEKGRFRRDLLFRLKVIHIQLPALRERTSDIPLLVSHYLTLFAARLGPRRRPPARHLARYRLQQDPPLRARPGRIPHQILTRHPSLTGVKILHMYAWLSSVCRSRSRQILFKISTLNMRLVNPRVSF